MAISIDQFFSPEEVQQKLASNDINQCLEVMIQVNNKSGRNAISDQELESVCQKIINLQLKKKKKINNFKNKR